MTKEKSFSWLSLANIAVFGVLCFLGGFLFSNIVSKKTLTSTQPRVCNRENGAFVSKDIDAGNGARVVKSAEKTIIAQRLSIDQRVQNIEKDMSFRKVESVAGVPRDKKRDLQGQEVWLYQSDKVGFRNCVYFDLGKVTQTKNLPLNGNID